MVWFHFCVKSWGREKRVREEKKREMLDLNVATHNWKKSCNSTSYFEE